MKHIKLFTESEENSDYSDPGKSAKFKLIKTLSNDVIEIKLGDWIEYHCSRYCLENSDEIGLY